MKIYLIKHLYDVDGGFGDSISNETILGAFNDKETAEKYVEKWDNPHVYSKPYDELWCGHLKMQEIEIGNLDFNKDPFEDYNWGNYEPYNDDYEDEVA